MGNGRPREHDRAAVCAQLFALMSSGECKSLRSACEKCGVSITTVMNWINDDKTLSEQYDRARANMLEAIADEVLVISDTPAPLTPTGTTDSGAVAQKRLQVDSRKWLLSKLAPKKYGERIEVAGDADNPLAVSLQVEFVKPNG